MGGGPTRERGRPARPSPGAARYHSPAPIDPKRRSSSPSARLASQESDRRAPLPAHQLLVLFIRPNGSVVSPSNDLHGRAVGLK